MMVGSLQRLAAGHDSIHIGVSHHYLVPPNHQVLLPMVFRSGIPVVLDDYE